MPPLDDRRVRLALNHAVDREALRGSIIPKDAIPASHMVIPSVAGWNPEVGKKVYAYDVAKTKQLLAEAKAAGVSVDRHIDIYGRINMWPNSTETMEALLTMWKAIGLNVTLRMLDVSQWTELNVHPNKGKSGSADEAKVANRDPILLGHMHDNNLGDPVFSMHNKYSCKNQSSTHCNQDLDVLIAKATALSGPERIKSWQEVMKIVHEDMVADVFLFHLVYYARVGKRIVFAPTSATNSEIPLEQIVFK